MKYAVFNETLGFVATLLKRSNEFWPNVPAGGILRRFDSTISTFETRKAACAAILRTMDYDQSNKSGMRVSEYSIMRLVPEVPEKKGAKC